MFTYRENGTVERITDESMQAAFILFGALGVLVAGAFFAAIALLPGFPVFWFAVAVALFGTVAVAYNWRVVTTGIEEADDE
jgi:type III secretory pathway component EscV